MTLPYRGFQWCRDQVAFWDDVGIDPYGGMLVNHPKAFPWGKVAALRAAG